MRRLGVPNLIPMGSTLATLRADDTLGFAVPPTVGYAKAICAHSQPARPQNLGGENTFACGANDVDMHGRCAVRPPCLKTLLAEQRRRHVREHQQEGRRERQEDVQQYLLNRLVSTMGAKAIGYRSHPHEQACVE